MERPNRTQAAAVAAICILYFAVRVWGLTDSCLWFDEMFSVHAAEHSWGDMFGFVALDLIHPPLFYALLKIWISSFGESLISLRIFPLLFSTLALLPFYLLCRELKLKVSTLLIALFLFAVNGALIKYSQEVRMYSVLLFLSLVSTWLFSRFIYRGKNIWVLTFVNAALVYTHYFGWFVVAAEVAAILVFQRIKIRHVLVMLAIDIAVFLPWVFALWKAVDAGSDVGQNISWIGRPGIAAVFTFAFDLIEPFYFQQTSADASSILWITLPILAVIGAAKVVYFSGWKKRSEKSALLLMAVFTLVPMLLAFAASWLSPFSIWGSRHLLVVFAPAIVSIAILVNDTDIRWLRNLFAAVILLASAAALVMRIASPVPQLAWCKWDEAAVSLAADGEREIYVFEDIVAYHAWFSTRDLETPPRVLKISGVDGIAEDTAYFLPRGFDAVDRKAIGDPGGSEIGVIFRATSLNEAEPPLRNLEVAGYHIESVREYDAGGQRSFAVRMSK